MKLNKKIIISVLVACGLIGSYVTYDLFNGKGLTSNIHQLIQNGFSLGNWTEFTPENKNFTIHFPSSPKSISKDLAIPRSDDTLPYQEYQCSMDGNRLLSVSYTVLPDNWAKWSSSIILKGALKVVLFAHKGSHLVGQSSNTFKGFSAIDYEHYNNDRETAGTLVLVGKTLYKVEMTYNKADKGSAQEDLAHFLGSFTPAQH